MVVDACWQSAAHLCKHVANLEYLQLRTPRFVFVLINSVGDYNFVKRTGVDAVDSVSTENAVGDQCIHLRSTLFLHQFGRASDGIRCVCQIVDEDGSAVCHIAHKHHSRVLPVADLCRSTLLVNQREWHTERIGDGCSSLRTSSIRTDDDSLLVIGDVRLDVLAEKMAPVQVVNWNVEEALVLRV